MIEFIKKLLAHFQAPQPTPLIQLHNDFGMKTKGKRIPNRSKEVIQPITSKIIEWIDSKKWAYNHCSSEQGDVHHLMLGFTGDDVEWTCAFYVNEQVQVVTMFGMLDDDMPTSHYTAVLMALTQANLDMCFGNFEFDPDDGEVRVRIAFDLKFGDMTNKALDHYFSLLLALIKKAYVIAWTALQDDKPSHLVGDYIEGYDIDNEIRVMVNNERRTFFIPTDVTQ